MSSDLRQPELEMNTLRSLTTRLCPIPITWLAIRSAERGICMSRCRTRGRFVCRKTLIFTQSINGSADSK
jgi:hypothetical protein